MNEIFNKSCWKPLEVLVEKLSWTLTDKKCEDGLPQLMEKKANKLLEYSAESANFAVLKLLLKALKLYDFVRFNYWFKMDIAMCTKSSTK